MTRAAATGAKYRRWGLLAALLALFAQALLPAAALAAESAGSRQTVLCTEQGAQLVTLDARGEPRQGFAGLPCQDCLGATLAVLAPSPPGVIVAIQAAAAPPAVFPAAPCIARAPPRPPGQGPPSSQA
ncbi:MAG: DUF2946 domain-containing protein [Phenylobacterium sp.]|uniref:DUF2946 domain-containing protein n=1 Tax=Phenylobacterium sp. TaxID=1871053 RepID=UPI003919B911